MIKPLSILIFSLSIFGSHSSGRIDANGGGIRADSGIDNLSKSAAPVMALRSGPMGTGVVPAAAARSTDRLFAAVVAVESGGDANAVGDKGKAHGLIQAHRAAWSEGGGKNYGVDTKDYAKCRAVFYAYGTRYGAKTDEQLCRCWNSGPGWRTKYAKTDGYWRRVCAAIGN